MGGDYITWFKDENSESRALLYKLETAGIVKLFSEKKEGGFYNHKWELTKKGKDIVDKDKLLQELWKKGDIVKFYDLISKKI
ncbi:MAG: hypothetical protein PHQ66_03190 [Candidatus Nanoarchaeia archaeon]|nr:hypothetical protein [Candidatus Nanoarchaeia archaeon]MDD5357631.1 hypothetical protein [Candidatus Nanoarchaeia archaeon]MDD5588550.1 hypothetical protein [Candidatus Nanoarchaeia archaeon]